MTDPALQSPIERFRILFASAKGSEPDVPEAMTLATSTPDGRPSARVVLLKGLDDSGFVFYTNYDSRKGKELDQNPHAALCFHFKTLRQQVRVEGTVKRVSPEESDAYFESRPHGSRIGAVASHQSQTIVDRDSLLARVAELEAKYPPGGPVPRPDHWGGYRLHPELIEFWVHRDDRLHDRWLYTRTESGWSCELLSP